MQCHICGATLPDSTQFCTNCGAPVTPANGAVPSNEQTPYYQQGQFTSNGQPQFNQQGQFAPNGQPQFNQQGQFPPNGQPQFNQQGQFPPNGQPQFNQQGQFGPNGPIYGAPGGMMSKKEFYKHPSMKRCRNNINACAIIMYACAGITFLVNVLLATNIFGLVDVCLLVGLGLGIHLGKSRVCAIISCVYGAFNVIYMIIETGSIGGWLILVAAIYAIIATFNFHKAWKTYQQTGAMPML